MCVRSFGYHTIACFVVVVDVVESSRTDMLVVKSSRTELYDDVVVIVAVGAIRR